ncbi:MAG: sugar ABC transporter substrate-binding protein [Nakamurella sp.]
MNDPAVPSPPTPPATPFSRRRFLSTSALIGAGLATSPFLTACTKQSTAAQSVAPAAGGATTRSAAASGSAIAPAGTGTKTTDFPSKLWKLSDTAGAKPSLDRRIAFQNVVSGAAALDLADKWLHQAADEIKFDYITANSQGNSAATISQMKQSIARGIMGMVAPGQDIPAQIAAMQTNMQKGGAMFLFNTGSVTCGMAAVQYTFGYTQGQFAARYIKDELGGDAKVLFINQNGSITLRPRETGFFDALKEAGVSKDAITSLDAGEIGTQEVAFKVMNTALQKSGDYNVVAGAQDELALGAMAALKAAGKWTAIPKLAVIGAEGTPQAVSYIKSGDTPFKATSAVHFPMVGYVPGRMIGRWADGQSIPQFLEYPSFLIDSADTANAFEKDLDRCPELYQDMLDGDMKYVVPRGEISYETRDGYYEGDLPIKLPTLET